MKLNRLSAIVEVEKYIFHEYGALLKDSYSTMNLYKPYLLL